MWAATLKGRTPDALEMMLQREYVRSLSLSAGLKYTGTGAREEKKLVSDEGLSKIVADDVRQYAQLEPIHPSMAGEDFCEYTEVALPVFAFIGSNGEEGCPDWHSPNFVGLDESLQAGVEFYTNAAFTVLNELA